MNFNKINLETFQGRNVHEVYRQLEKDFDPVVIKFQNRNLPTHNHFSLRRITIYTKKEDENIVDYCI